MFQNGFPKFSSGNVGLENAPRSGRPIEVADDKIKAHVDADHHITTREIAEKLRLSNSTVHDHFKRLGTVSKLDMWIPYREKLYVEKMTKVGGRVGKM